MALMHTPVCDFGWKAPEFTLQTPTGKSFTMSENIGENGLLIAFICNHCPYVLAIIDRLVEVCKTLQDEKVGVLAVMPNNYEKYPDDSPENMVQFAKKHDFSFPYLLDEEQAVAKAYNAICTPDFFGFNASGELHYRGRIDDAKLHDASNCTPDLLNAMQLIAKTGKGPEAQTPSMGCSIKWK